MSNLCGIRCKIVRSMRISPGLTVGGTGTVAAEYAGDQRCNGHKENGDLGFIGCFYGNIYRNDL